MKTTVKREDDRVWLEGVGGWFVGDQESSVHAAQAAVMQAVGEDISYVDLLGASVLAFRMQVSKDGLCPSSPHATCGCECVEGALNALPWQVQGYSASPDDSADVEMVRQAVVDSINRGVPVQYGSEEDGVIVGYQQEGEAWICLHPMHQGGSEKFVETTWPWGIAIYTQPKPRVPSKRGLALGALKQAVEMSEAEQAEGYYLGFTAWDNYLAKLRGLQEAEDQVCQDSMLGNSWIYENLVQSRRYAALYLRDVAEEFGAETADHLRKAADLYEQMATQTLCDSEHCVIAIAPLPWSLKEGESWTTEMRADQIRRLEVALPLERAALQEIRAALGKEG
jgi:hypothetical protein